MMGYANCQSFEKLVIDNNICGMALRLVGGIECTDETIALDILKSSGRGAKGHLISPHTMKSFIRKKCFFLLKSSQERHSGRARHRRRRGRGQRMR
jgi:trimethylamine--corrinoid protein Co-methyltransferase